MSGLIRAMNPTANLSTEPAALDAARISTTGMVLGAVNQAVAGWYASTEAGRAAAAAMVEQLVGQAPSADEVAQQAQIGLMTTGVLVLLQLGLAAVQWRKPNGVLPTIFLILVIWGLGTASLAFFVPAVASAQPLWLTMVTVVLLAIAAVTHIASIRGSSALNRIRMDAAR
jgi:hypothetical protein